MNIKSLVFKHYKIINIFPFNNRKRGKIIIRNEGSVLINCSIKNLGKNNVLVFAKGGVYKNCTFEVYGDNNCIEFGENCFSKDGSFYIEDSNNAILTGNNTTYAGKIHIACTEGSRIIVGNNCLFSSEIVIRSGDSHSILDMNGFRINHAKNVIIDNYVWVGHRVLINKGVKISQNCIVGTGSVLTKQYDQENSIIAGNPAKVVKTDVSWMTERI